MNPYLFFFVFNILAFFCWVPLFVAPYHKFTSKYVEHFYVPIFFAVVYICCFTVMVILTEVDSTINVLDQIKRMFETPWGFLAGWVHYLCFDFVVGSYIVISAKKINLNKALLSLCLILTFLAGPIGFVIYRSIKIAKTRI